MPVNQKTVDTASKAMDAAKEAQVVAEANILKSMSDAAATKKHTDDANKKMQDALKASRDSKILIAQLDQKRIDELKKNAEDTKASADALVAEAK